MSVSDPYKVLQVDPAAEYEVIESAYRRLARKYHPDVSSEPDSHEKMIAINQAWEQLRDPVKRAAVDRARLRMAGAAAWVAAADAHANTGGKPASPAHASATPPASPVAPPGYPHGGPVGTPTARDFGSMTDPAFAASSGGADTAAASGTAGPRSWASGRVSLGGSASGAASRPDGAGAAGPPPGKPSGSVLNFGRYSGWSLGEIARVETEYLEWLSRMPIGRTYQQEIDEILRAKGLRPQPAAAEPQRRGRFRR